MNKSTLQQIPDSFYDNTKLFVPEAELQRYQMAVKNVLYKKEVECIPVFSPNLALKRLEMAQWAKKNGYTKFCMLDDDIIQIAVRDEGRDGIRLKKSSPLDRIEMFETVDQYLQWYSHMGVSQRLFNQVFEGEGPVVVENTRMVRFLCYQVDLFISCIHGRIITSEDMDITLQLLLRGYKNCVLYKWSHDQMATGTPGGCSVYRTLELHNSDKELMRSIYPSFTRLQHKKNKGGAAVKAGMAERLECVVNWNAAYQEGLRRREAAGGEDPGYDGSPT